jgi:hypothetical protein
LLKIRQIQAKECGLTFDPNICLRWNLGQNWPLHIDRIQIEDQSVSTRCTR